MIVDAAAWLRIGLAIPKETVRGARDWRLYRTGATRDDA